jgi:hypothetical protein
LTAKFPPPIVFVKLFVDDVIADELSCSVVPVNVCVVLSNVVKDAFVNILVSAPDFIEVVGCVIVKLVTFVKAVSVAFVVILFVAPDWILVVVLSNVVVDAFVVILFVAPDWILVVVLFNVVVEGEISR